MEGEAGKVSRGRGITNVRIQERFLVSPSLQQLNSYDLVEDPL